MAADRRLRNPPGSEAVPRQAADRHYLGVVTAEARRLARQLRAAGAGRGREDRRIAEQDRSEVSH